MTVHEPPALPLTEQVAAQLAGLSIHELGERLRIVLPDRTVSVLNQSYLFELHRNVTETPGVYRDRLHADQQGLFFVDEAGDRLNLVLTNVLTKQERLELIIDQSGSMNLSLIHI